jgi:hypothetical protein
VPLFALVAPDQGVEPDPDLARSAPARGVAAAPAGQARHCAIAGSRTPRRAALATARAATARAATPAQAATSTQPSDPAEERTR